MISVLAEGYTWSVDDDGAVVREDDVSRISTGARVVGAGLVMPAGSSPIPPAVQDAIELALRARSR